jgi:hypothetical protein
VVFTEGSGPVALVGGGPAVVAVVEWRHRPHERWGGRATQLGEVSSTPRMAGPQPSAASRRRPHTVPGKANGRVVRLGGPVVVRSDVAGE